MDRSVRIQHVVTTVSRDLESVAGGVRWFVQSREEVTDLKIFEEQYLQKNPSKAYLKEELNK